MNTNRKPTLADLQNLSFDQLTRYAMELTKMSGNRAADIFANLTAAPILQGDDLLRARFGLNVKRLQPDLNQRLEKGLMNLIASNDGVQDKDGFWKKLASRADALSFDDCAKKIEFVYLGLKKLNSLLLDYAFAKRNIENYLPQVWKENKDTIEAVGELLLRQKQLLVELVEHDNYADNMQDFEIDWRGFVVRLNHVDSETKKVTNLDSTYLESSTLITAV